MTGPPQHVKPAASPGHAIPMMPVGPPPLDGRGALPIASRDAALIRRGTPALILRFVLTGVAMVPASSLVVIAAGAAALRSRALIVPIR